MSLRPPDPQAIVVFGASGDLTSRKIMPALYNLFVQDLLPEGFAIIGYSRTKYSDEDFRKKAKEDVAEFSRTKIDKKAWEAFAAKVRYVSGEFDSEGAMDHLVDHLKDADESFGVQGRRMFYCATPPSAFPHIANRLRETGLAADSKIVIEKPFGSDLKSARDLNETLHEAFGEDQIFRIDHYLGKETVQNILVFRFSNGMFEPIWNRRHVARVEIDVAESIGIEGRGRFYEEAGAMRDIMQNHVLQLLAFLTMEPPAAFEAPAIRAEKIKLLGSIPPVEVKSVVRGQYASGTVDGERVPGYREEPDVAPDSKTETFAAIRVEIENWRWAGIPFYLRTGKRLARRATSATIVFNEAPLMIFRQSGIERPDPNHIEIRIQPDEGIALSFGAKVPGPEMRVAPVVMDFNYEESFMTEPSEAYERLIHDVMCGDQTLFTSAEEIERAWEILDPVLQPAQPDPYFAGTWGPQEAGRLIAPHAWHLR
jgi:glucose-6-phosphate 1-dehydrogenase